MLTTYPLPIGNAIKILGRMPAGTLQWRLLRKATNTFSGPLDVAASLIDHGWKQPQIYAVDTTGLTNGTTYYYQVYAHNGTVWAATEAAPVAAVPEWNIEDHSVDPLSLVRDRLDAGLRRYVAQGLLFHDAGYIPVLTAPPLFDETAFPVVTVHLTQDGSAERGLGEHIAGDEFDAVDDRWSDHEGWLSRVDLTIAAWSLNPDERMAVRQAVKAVIIGNLPVLAGAGLLQIDFSMSDTEDMQGYNAPLYQVMGRFSCLAPSLMVTTHPILRDVDVAVNHEAIDEELMQDG